MRREFHVRFCEGPGVRSPRATRRNVYVRSKRAGERVMALLRRLYAKLRLRVNESKSAVDWACNRKLLGYSMYVAKSGEIKRRVAPKALQAMKRWVRKITRRNRSQSIVTVAADLRSYLVGWKRYFELAETPWVLRSSSGVGVEGLAA